MKLPENIKLYSTREIYLRILLIVFIAEFIIMLFLDQVVSPQNRILQNFMDPLLLTLIIAPLIYFLVIRPFILARDSALEHVENLAMTDQLTGIPNRRAIQQQVEQFIESSKRRTLRGAMMSIDLDGFKNINDAHSHQAGDTVLIKVAARIKNRIRAEDLVGRLGGDEFMVLIKYANEDEAIAKRNLEHIAKQIIEDIEMPITYKDKTLKVTASVGIKYFGEKPFSFDEIFKVADLAMYSAKKSTDYSYKID